MISNIYKDTIYNNHVLKYARNGGEYEKHKTKAKDGTSMLGSSNEGTTDR